MKVLATMAVAAALLGLGACGEETALHEPGVYQGERDPLLEKQAQRRQRERLRERVMMVQTDR